MEINMVAKDMQKTERLLNGVRKTLDQTIEEILDNIDNEIIFEAKNNIQQNQNINTGSLLASIQVLEKDTRKHEHTIGSDQPYAYYIEYGRGPVFASEGKTLHWIDKTTGKDVFAKSAKATEPQPFLEPAIILVTKKIKDISAEKINTKNEQFIR